MIMLLYVIVKKDFIKTIVLTVKLVPQNVLNAETKIHAWFVKMD